MRIAAWILVGLIIAATVFLIARSGPDGLTTSTDQGPSGSSQGVLSVTSTPSPTLIPMISDGLLSGNGISTHHNSASAMLRELSGNEPPASPGGAETIDTASEAISLTLAAEFPSGFTPTQTIVRLWSRETFEEDFLGYAPGDYDGSLGPVWVVGITASGMTDQDVLPSNAPIPSYTPPAAKSVPGAYYAWDANRSTIQSRGVLHSSGSRTMSTLAAIADESVTIATATDLPFVGTPGTP